MKRWRASARRGERGAVAVVVAISMVALMAAAAIGVDVARLVFERQQLQNSLDAAAAAGVLKLPGSPADAIKEAEKFASDNMVSAGLGPINSASRDGALKIALRCVTSYNTTTKSPDWTTVLAVCGISSHTFDPLDCDADAGVCSVKCTTSDHCNTIVVKYDKTVDFSFGPAIGIATGKTGTVVAAACRGFCGTVAPNPMDIVVMTDRTPSMQDGWSSGTFTTPTGSFQAMKDGVEDMLTSMNQDQQYVAFGTIAISVPTTTNKAAPPNGGEAFTDADYQVCTGSGKSKVCTWTPTGKKWHFKGSWVPVGFTNKYTLTNSAGVQSLNTASDLYKAVHNLGFSSPSVNYPRASDGSLQSGNEATHLAAALKGATRYLLNTDPSTNLGLPVRPKEFGTPKKVIIFETDGAPQELFNSDSSAVSLTNDLDIGVAGDFQKQSCNNLVEIARQAKNAGITIITIGIGAINKATCGSGSTSMNARDMLAATASNSKITGKPSDAYDCTQTGKTEAENSDGDYYFCAATSAQLKGVFLAAMGTLTDKSKLMRLPNAASLT